MGGGGGPQRNGKTGQRFEMRETMHRTLLYIYIRYVWCNENPVLENDNAILTF